MASRWKSRDESGDIFQFPTIELFPEEEHNPSLSTGSALSSCFLFHLICGLIFLVFSTTAIREYTLPPFHLSRTFINWLVNSYSVILLLYTLILYLLNVFCMLSSLSLCFVHLQLFVHCRFLLWLSWNQIKRACSLSYSDDSFQRIKIILPFAADAF